MEGPVLRFLADSLLPEANAVDVVQAHVEPVLPRMMGRCIFGKNAAAWRRDRMQE